MEVELPFDIGETVWFVGPEYREEVVPCPICAGDRVVTVSNSSGETWRMECAACRDGYHSPKGHIVRHIPGYWPTQVTLTRLGGDFDRPYYQDESRSDLGLLYPDKLFYDFDDCKTMCEQLHAEKSKEEERRYLANRESKGRDMAWSIYYWRRQKRDLEKQLGWVNARIQQIKEGKWHEIARR